MSEKTVSFLTFFLVWARLQGWEVPLLHVRICVWLEKERHPERVLMVFRGAAKSTIYAVYKAWRLYRNRSHRSLVWSADNDTAGMLTADTINVLRNHPLTRGMLPAKPGAKRFWVTGARDARNASMRAVGVNTNATGARADDVDFDDIEVPGNIESVEARTKLRNRISESTHIAVPGAQKTYIGTPHTHDSIYPERIARGAAVLKITLFEHSARFTETRERTRYPLPPIGDDGLYVMAGISKTARMLREGLDYRLDGGDLVFAEPPGVTIDVCSMCAWPERFTRAEIELRRKETLTFNAWDSQYGLEAKPLSEIRLDPSKLVPYADELVLIKRNRVPVLMLGSTQIVGMAARWDPAGGKLKSDVSAVAIVPQDAIGRRYLHRVAALTGEVAEFDKRGERIVGGQVHQLCDLIEACYVTRIVVETNGIGQFAPVTLRAALKQRRLRCGVVEEPSVQNKARRILEALEAPLSSAMLYVHTSVEDGPLWPQMKDWNPAEKNQPDDYLDAAAGAVSETPERVGRTLRNLDATPAHDWRPDVGVFEAELEI